MRPSEIHDSARHRYVAKPTTPASPSAGFISLACPRPCPRRQKQRMPSSCLGRGPQARRPALGRTLLSRGAKVSIGSPLQNQSFTIVEEREFLFFLTSPFSFRCLPREKAGIPACLKKDLPDADRVAVTPTTGARLPGPYEAPR